MNDTWTRRGVLAMAVMMGISLGVGLSERWFGQTLAAPETEPTKVPATTMALIDVQYIFKNHKSFNDQMRVLEYKSEVFNSKKDAEEESLKALKGRIEQTTDKAEKAKIESELAKQQSDGELLARTSMRELFESEAKIYSENYMFFQEETKKYCRSRGIQTAMLTSRNAIKSNDRESVFKGLNRTIVFSDAPDISDDILKAMDAAVEAKAAKAKTEETKSR